MERQTSSVQSSPTSMRPRCSRRQAAAPHVHHHGQPYKPTGETPAGLHHCPSRPLCQQPPTSDDDCVWYCRQRDVVPHPMSWTFTEPGHRHSSNWCGRFQHQLPNTSGRETDQAVAGILGGEIPNQRYVSGRKTGGQTSSPLPGSIWRMLLSCLQGFRSASFSPGPSSLHH